MTSCSVLTEPPVLVGPDLFRLNFLQFSLFFVTSIPFSIVDLNRSLDHVRFWDTFWTRTNVKTGLVSSGFTGSDSGPDDGQLWACSVVSWLVFPRSWCDGVHLQELCSFLTIFYLADFWWWGCLMASSSSRSFGLEMLDIWRKTLHEALKPTRTRFMSTFIIKLKTKKKSALCEKTGGFQKVLVQFWSSSGPMLNP